MQQAATLVEKPAVPPASNCFLRQFQFSNLSGEKMPASKQAGFAQGPCIVLSGFPLREAATVAEKLAVSPASHKPFASAKLTAGSHSQL